MCVIVSEESDVAAFKSLTAADLGGDAAPAGAPSPPAAAAPAPAAAAPAAGPKKDYPAHTTGVH